MRGQKAKQCGVKKARWASGGGVAVWGGGKAAKPKANRGGARGGGKVV